MAGDGVLEGLQRLANRLLLQITITGCRRPASMEWDPPPAVGDVSKLPDLAKSLGMASRSAKSDANTPAKVMFHTLPSGRREEKFTALSTLRLDSQAWTKCPSDWRAPFLPASLGAWATYPKLEDLFIYNGSGVMPGRTWGPSRWTGVVAPSRPLRST